MAKLVLFLADGTTLNIPLARERLTIGRRADNDVCLPNLAVSGEHAAVVTILADSFLEDLGSTNGTLVNGSPIAKHFLRDRDEIDIGRHKLVYCVDDDVVLAPVVDRSALRAAAGDLGQQVEAAKPVARAKRAPGAARGKRADANAPRAGAAAPPAKTPAPPAGAAAAVKPASLALASVKLLSGPGAGTTIAITKDRTTIGRAGVQVAMIDQSGRKFRLKPVEGEAAPVVNGESAPAQGGQLKAGDVIEIAGTKLEFALPPSL